MWYCQKGGHIDQWTEQRVQKYLLYITLYIYNTYIYVHIHIWLIFDEDAEVIQWTKKEQSFKKQWLNNCKSIPPPKMIINPYLTPYTKFNKKWIVGLNVEPKTIKLLGKKI